MSKTRLVRTLCIFLMATVLAVALIFVVAMATGMIAGPEETTDYHFTPSEPGQLGDWTQGETSTPDIPGPIPPAYDPNGSIGKLPFGDSLGDAFDGDVMLIQSDRDNDRVYLKMESFGDYTGQGWTKAEAYPELLYDAYSMDFFPLLRQTESVSIHTMSITPLIAVRVIPYYLAFVENGVQLSDVRAEGPTDEAYQLSYAPEVRENEFRADAVLTRYEQQYQAYVQSTYTQVPEESVAFLKEIIYRENLNASDPQIIEQVAEYVCGAASYNSRYNAEMDTQPDIVAAFLGEYREGECRHFASAAVLLYRMLGIPARYVVGFATPVEGQEPVTVTAKTAHAWAEVYIDGFGWRYVEATPSQSQGTEPDDRITVRLTPTVVSKLYDGTPLTPVQEVTGFEDLTALGYTYKTSIVGERTAPGISESHIEDFVIYDRFGQDVTEDFTVISRPGKMQIYLQELHIVSKSFSKIYDGIPLTLRADQFYPLDAELPEGYDCRLIPTGTQSNVGVGVASFQVQILHLETAMDGSDGVEWVDRTDYFLVHRTFGSLTVTAAPLTIKAEDATKVYDGTALIARELMFVEGVLADGDRIDAFEITGSQTAIGRSDNVITRVVIRNADGADVTRNYDIKLLPGTLRVTGS